MQKLTQEVFQQVIDMAGIKPRIKREVRFTTSVAHLDDETWERTELLPIVDRAGNKGVLLFQIEVGEMFAVSFELSRGLTSSTGKAQAIICDFCRTWQTGSRSGSITLKKAGRETGSITFLCCADLECSRHVRNITSAAKTSRSQLREDIDTDQRISRLKHRLEEVASQLGISPVAL